MRTTLGLQGEQQDAVRETPQPDLDRGIFESMFSEEAGGSEGVRWTLFTGLACIPFLNWGVRPPCYSVNEFREDIHHT